MSGDVLNLHAGCILLGEAGILIRGASGSGKSSLARRLVAGRLVRGGFAAFVADDRVILTRRHGRLVARPHAAIAGLAEHRGLGILPVPHEEAAVVTLVVDLTEEPAPRMPSRDMLETSLLGVAIARVAGTMAEAQALVEEAVSWQG